MMRRVDVAALVVSLVALLISAWAAYTSYTTRQAAERSADAAEVSADAATEALELGHATEVRERERAYAEQTPLLTATASGSGRQFQTIRLRNDSRFTYDSLSLTIRPTTADPVQGFAAGVDPVEIVEEIGLVGGLPPQGVFEFVVVRHDRYHSEEPLYLSATATRGEDTWTVDVTVELPRGGGWVSFA